MSKVTEEEILKYASSNGPKPTIHYIDLPLTRLHYAKCGQGPPLIMVPASISRLHEWIALTQFFGAHYTVYFFELPGHGDSTSFSKSFTTQQVAETIKDFIDGLGLDKVSILGFSFGGLLTMRAIYYIKERVKSVILYAPSLTKKAIKLSKLRVFISKVIIKLLRIRLVRGFIVTYFKKPTSVKFLSWFLKKFGNLDFEVNNIEDIRAKMSDTALEVLTYQMEEIFNLSFPVPEKKLTQPCYFGMSVNDTMIDFNLTLEEVNKHFETVGVIKYDFHYHQPSKYPSLERIKKDFSGFLELTKPDWSGERDSNP